METRNEQAQADRTEAWVDRMGRALSAGRSPRQRELADTIYKRLKSGAEVDDVKSLIADLSRVAAEDRRRAREST